MCSCFVRFVYFVLSVFSFLCSVGSCVVVVCFMFLLCLFISMTISLIIVSAICRLMCCCSLLLFCVCVMCFVVWFMFWCRVWLSSFLYVSMPCVGMNLCVRCRRLWMGGVIVSVSGVRLM